MTTDTLVGKTLDGIQKWQPSTYLGIMCIALLVVVAFDKIESWRGGNPDHVAILNQLSELATSSRQGAATARLQAVTIDYFVCDGLAAQDGAARSKCYNEYLTARRELDRR